MSMQILEKIMDYRYNLAKLLAAAGIAAISASSAFALDQGDAAKGEKVFKKCQSCHQVGDEAKNGTGPMLNGLFGRVAGSVDGYKYGKHLVAAGEAGLSWNDEELFEYLKDPRKYLRTKLDDKKAKSKMSLKLKKDKDRINVIAFLKTHSPEVETGDDAQETSAD